MNKIIPHLLFILSVMFLTFIILDQFNPAMNFINNNISTILLAFFALLSLINSIITIVNNKRNK